MIPTLDHSSATRLRRLDALFAERVMGYEVQGALSAVDDYYQKRGSGPTWEFELLSRYTRSLDAAWEGATHLPRELFSYEVELRHDDCGDHAVVKFPRDGFRYVGDVTSHPAEALVLACLRAVGCSEEELV